MNTQNQGSREAGQAPNLSRSEWYGGLARRVAEIRAARQTNLLAARKKRKS